MIEVNHLSSGQCSVGKNKRFKTWKLRSNFCDYSDAYIVAKKTTNLLAGAANENGKADYAFQKLTLN